MASQASEKQKNIFKSIKALKKFHRNNIHVVENFVENDYNALERKATKIVKDRFKNCKLMFSDNINGVVRYDFAQNPSVWFIMNSINAKKPNDGFLCGMI